jgi:hypothetical protein
MWHRGTLLVTTLNKSKINVRGSPSNETTVLFDFGHAIFVVVYLLGLQISGFLMG